MRIVRLLSLVCLLGVGYQGLAQPDIFFEIRNQQIVSGTYEFDVYMKSSQSGTYHSRGQVYIYYNPAAFGNTVVFNGQVNVTELDLLNEKDLFGGTKYQTVNVADNGNRVAVTWQMVYQSIAASNLTHTIVPDTFTPLYHIAIQMQNVNQPANLAFDYNLMGVQQFFLWPNTTTELQYTLSGLPVTWSFFEADRHLRRDVMLRWGTEKETNNAYFEIEKARGGGDFEPIARVDGKGTTSDPSQYRYLDQTAMGSRNYYRLKQVDLDGSISYSETVEVLFGYFGEDAFLVYPVPATETLTLEAESRSDRAYPFRVMNTFGKTLQRGVLDAEARSIDISIVDLPAGSYFVVIEGPERKQYTHRFIKHHP